MSGLLDKAIGLYHFGRDRAPQAIPRVGPRPRVPNRWCDDGQALVSRVAADGDIKAAVARSLGLLGTLSSAISGGERVLVKPNFNSDDPYPASTDLGFLRAVVELLVEAGARVTIGESSGGLWRPTRKVLHRLGVTEMARRMGVELIAFEDRADDWVQVDVGGEYLSTVTVPRAAYEADRFVYLPCLRTHNMARFSGALKLAVGFMHPGERRALHARHLERKVAEINLCWQPDLIVMDGRKVFVSGGPDKGELAEPGLLLASGDLVAIDVEAMKVLLSYGGKNKLVPDPWHSLQVATALKHGLGASIGNYRVVE